MCIPQNCHERVHISEIGIPSYNPGYGHDACIHNTPTACLQHENLSLLLQPNNSQEILSHLVTLTGSTSKADEWHRCLATGSNEPVEPDIVAATGNTQTTICTSFCSPFLDSDTEAVGLTEWPMLPTDNSCINSKNTWKSSSLAHNTLCALSGSVQHTILT